jgi:triphosphatase
MLPQKELELKFEVEPSALRFLDRVQAIKALKRHSKYLKETSVYFDTDHHKLHKKGLMLRVRRIGNRRIQTVKASGTSVPIERSEWESEIANAEPDLKMIHGTPLEDLITTKVARRLKPVFETRIRRTTYSLSDSEGAVELTIDHGTINTGGASMPVCELELELKRGSRNHLFAIAQTLTRALPTQISLKSKAERGYQLIDGVNDLPVKAFPVHLSTNYNARDSFNAIAFGCLKQIIDNVAAITRADLEGVHQMRVGIRRLRAAMSIFKEILGDEQTTAVKSELKWLTRELAPAREFAVLLKRVAAPPKNRGGPRNGITSLSTLLERKQRAALARASEAVTSDRFRSLSFGIATWLKIGRWVDPDDDLIRSRGNALIQAFAADELQRRSRKVRKRGKDLAHLSAKERHKLRIRVKKLRYAAEFFSDLFQKKSAARHQKRFTSALKLLQTGLGDLNDIAVNKRLIAGVAAPRHGFAVGLVTGHEEERENEAMSSAIDGHAELVKVKVFWQRAL